MMTSTTRAKPRSLIVVSSDWRELGLATYFLRGQAFASEAAIAVPLDRALFPAWRHLPVACLPYENAEDILSIVDARKPDLVFLFSAYLFGKEGLFLTPGSLPLDGLLGQLRDRGCRVITSDPLLGLAPQLSHAQLNPDMLGPSLARPNRLVLRAVLRLKTTRNNVARVPRLENVSHLYPTSIPDTADHTPKLSFFNPTILRAAGDARAVDDAQDQKNAARDARPRWLFVLSDADLHVQQLLLGLSEFVERLLGMLRHAAANEAQPTLIAPPSVVARLAQAVPAGAELLSFCPYPEFERRVLEAEYAFYWSAFSTSLLMRVANELPIFLFDRGQLARAIEPYYARAVACHFGGWEPTYLDPRQVFSPYVLAHLAKAQKPALRALSERWRASPSPDAIVNLLMKERMGAESA